MCRIHAGKVSATSSQLEELPVSDAIAELCSRRVTAVQYAEALLQRIEKHSCINAFAHLDAEKVSVRLVSQHLGKSNDPDAAGTNASSLPYQKPACPTLSAC